MLVFRFRVIFEDVDDIERVIDVSGKNTFRDLHNQIQLSIGFDGLKEASFFKVNDIWRGDEEFCTSPKQNAKAAGASEIGKYIDDPHQKFIYKYDPENEWTLRLELIKLFKDDGKTVFPSVYKSKGVAPKQYVNPLDIINDPAAKLFKEADDLIASLTDDLVGFDETKFFSDEDLDLDLSLDIVEDDSEENTDSEENIEAYQNSDDSEENNEDFFEDTEELDL